MRLTTRRETYASHGDASASRTSLQRDASRQRELTSHAPRITPARKLSPEALNLLNFIWKWLFFKVQECSYEGILAVCDATANVSHRELYAGKVDLSAEESHRKGSVAHLLSADLRK